MGERQRQLSPRRDRARSALFLGVSVVFSAALILTSWLTRPLPQMLFGHDLMVLLDGGWKWHWGFRPHLDYYSPFGPLSYFLVNVGIVLGGGVASALPTAVVLFAILALPIALYGSFSRLDRRIAALATLVLVAMVLAPHMLKFPATAWTYATIYNRWGYLIFSTVVLVLTVPACKVPRVEAADGVIVGSLVCLALMLKVSYGILAVAVLGAAAICRPRRSAFWIGVGITGAVSFVGFGYEIGWAFPQCLNDLRIASHARSGLGVSELLQWTLFLWPDLVPLLLAIFILFTCRLSQAPLREQLCPWLLIVFAFVACAVAIEMSNSPLGQLRENPLLSLGSLVVVSALLDAELWSSGVVSSVQRSMLTTSACLALALLVFAPLSFSVLAVDNPENFPGWFRFLALHAKFTRHDQVIMLALGFGWSIAVAMIRWRPSALRRVAIRFAIAVAFLIAGQSFFRNLSGIYRAAQFRSQGGRLSAAETFSSGQLAGQQIAGFGGDPPLPTSYVEKVQDGLALLRTTGNAEQPVISFDFSNPFDVARGVKPNRTGPTCWQLNFVYSITAAPAPERVLSQDSVLMVPKLFGDGNQQNLTAIRSHYGAAVQERFHVGGESEQWVVFVPNQRDTGAR